MPDQPQQRVEVGQDRYLLLGRRLLAVMRRACGVQWLVTPTPEGTEEP